MSKPLGKIIIQPDLNIWPHEMRTAEALAKAGYVVEFVRKSEIDYEKTADTRINGEKWEIEAPERYVSYLLGRFSFILTPPFFHATPS